MNNQHEYSLAASHTPSETHREHSSILYMTQIWLRICTDNNHSWYDFMKNKKNLVLAKTALLSTASIFESQSYTEHMNVFVAMAVMHTVTASSENAT